MRTTYKHVQQPQYTVQKNNINNKLICKINNYDGVINSLNKNFCEELAMSIDPHSCKFSVKLKRAKNESCNYPFAILRGISIPITSRFKL
jgi:hypothetical protein